MLRSALKELVGQTFTNGEVVLRGIMLCDPCSHLEALTTAGIKKALEQRGGLRAKVVKGGVLHEGDTIAS